MKDSPYADAAVPLARLITDARDEIQLEAIAAELNIFLAEKVVTRRRVGVIVERRAQLAAEPVFAAGPLALGGQPVPVPVIDALRAAERDDNGRVALEALYAFGALAPTLSSSDRASMVVAAGPELAGFLGSTDPAMRFAAARVMGRVLAKRRDDAPLDTTVGDALVGALNDKDEAVRAAAAQSLGLMRYDRAVVALGELFAFHARGPEAEAALDALARIANPASAPLLTTQLTSKSAALRGIAVEGLARVGDPESLSEIQAALANERSAGVVLALAFARTLLANAAIDPIVDAAARGPLQDQARQYLLELATSGNDARIAEAAQQAVDRLRSSRRRS